MSSRVANKHSNAAAAASSVFFSQHDRDHALGDRGISWIGGVVRETFVEVVDLEKDPMAVRIERAKVVLFVRSVAGTKVAEHAVGLDVAGDAFAPGPGEAG